ncbi:hypothetical protein ERO13_A01G145138v2 [Gossypium hirsutum]|nr:hypothetical protein ES319_A01G152700v1 [Gossypium barbadense]KAG4214866.1 hypothetical protein ERO13_A01G145138v2 [Gossypium hirsutum]TYJ49752.1 hypothetical protein E1A91_A01G157000v1 [Gossypium mustelinum]
MQRRNQEGNTMELVCVGGEVKQGLLQQQQQQKQEEKTSLRTLLRTWPRKGIQRGATPVATAAARRGYPGSPAVVGL